ncbi:MFS transporter [Streptomyces nanshensis]|uniref:MFS transporter n=1 Tax=Streptomyces nanshensis TaxID=518642 RepID=UPI00085BE121|nr:MFS transporter [Streptomyces nanshensis]
MLSSGEERPQAEERPQPAAGVPAENAARARARLGVAMFGVLLAAYAVNAMDRMVFPVLLPDVRAEYGFGLGAAGLQSTMFALGMGVTGIPAGLLVARMRRRDVVVLGTVLFSAATLLTVVSAGFADMLVWRLLSGVGEALQLTAIIAIAASAFARHRGAAVGSVNMAFAAGSVIGPALGGYLLSQYGTWRAPMVAFGVLGLVLAVVVVVAVRRWFTEAASPVGEQVTQVGGASRLLSRNPMVLAAVTVLFGLADFGFIGMYASYLREQLGYSSGQAGLVVGLSGLAAFASIVGGHLVDRINPRTAVAGFQILGALAAVALFVGSDALWWQSVWSFLFGLFASAGSYVALAGCLVKSVDLRNAGRAAGLFVTAIYVPAGFAGYLFSLLATLSNWQAAGLIQLGALSLIGAALTLLLRPQDFSRPVPPSAPVTEHLETGS